MRKKDTVSMPAVGAGSLLASFAVLCLAVFALLSMTTVRTQERLEAASTRGVTAYYAADLQAEEIFARLRAQQLPEGVVRQENRYTYRCPISENQHLLVVLEQREDTWQVLCWQAVARETEEQTDTLPVWQGSVQKEEQP